ncbi:aldehyde dehydrogenase [Nocardia neocaledoniensis NBRC 108232]|uniref:Betaine-aldehyde dehydrogenase n=1 Tax=Nocardia neocaledoniensis TaxID=236511 RepID=A0A317N221_9NOCA|nr:aldehyde dehydrogenase family protein [Nocardia neocaledoniensis]PWV67563.1 betaine-aldehyde dehydrogenase [Nocardia neocaledoniensis]GEM31261.1 aldehyde dehydrogenase [Nocardia neocaledoniensis NBRC 108232]
MTTKTTGDGLRIEVSIPHPDAVLVGGVWRPSRGGQWRPVISPATERPVTDVVVPTAADADDAVTAATEAFTGEWPRLPVGRRAEVVSRFADLLEERLDELTRLWAVEAGIPVRWGRTLHRFAAVTAWRTALATAESALAAESRSTPVGPVSIEYEAVGPVVAVMPYNGPLPTIGCKVIPALLAGSTVVVKAAPESALTMRLVSECAVAAGFPPGVLSILAADADVSAHLVRDPRVEVVSFTGGPRAAAEILRQTADNLPRTVFELGGKSPAILLDDVDLEMSLRALVAGSMSGAGQVCAALSRILVPAGRHDEIADALATAYRALRIGDPAENDTDHGPLANRVAYDRTEAAVRTAVADGAEIVCGGKRPDARPDGWFYEPTLLTGADPRDRVAQEEIFGPVAVLLPYDDVDEAVRIADGTRYGLAASVFTADPERGLAVARRLRSGSVAINTFGPTMAAPFGGVKRSGWGRECGPEGIREFAAAKQVLLG